MIELLNCDCMEAMRNMADNSIDAVVTDPPYGLVSIQKRFGKKGSAPAQFGKDGSFARLSKGFMGKEWDGSGIEYSVEFWSEVLRVLKPGGYLLSFGGSRTYHRMACAIEDAGFEIRDQIMWIYGSGFPKSLDIGKAIDKMQGNEREQYTAPIAYPDSDCWGVPNHNSKGTKGMFLDAGKVSANGIVKRSRGTSEYEGWGTALKPAHEPICMARKPLGEKTVASNVLKYGTGGINIDGCRICTDEKLNGGRYADLPDLPDGNAYGCGINKRSKQEFVQPQGRFPANVIHDGSDEVVGMFPNTKSGNAVIGTGKGFAENPSGIASTGIIASCFGDEGSASRFFYCAKASKSERGENNNHPTVKPIALMRYLCKLVTPPAGIVLDPFMGSGSTGVAAKIEGFSFIGIEREADYCKIAEARIEAAEEEKPMIDPQQKLF